MDRLTESRAVFAPNRRVSSETWMTDSLMSFPSDAQHRISQDLLTSASPRRLCIQQDEHRHHGVSADMKAIVFALLFVTASTTGADELAGLWKAKKRFGPDAHGPVVLLRSGETWTADMIGRVLPVARQRRSVRGRLHVLSPPPAAAGWLAPRGPAQSGARPRHAAGRGAAHARRQCGEAHREAPRNRTGSRAGHLGRGE